MTGQCFKDHKNLVLNGLIRKENALVTIENCQEFCVYYGYAFAGVKNSKRCLCGDMAPTKFVSSSKCNKPCLGNSTQKCGGKLAINVFAVSKLGKKRGPPEYQNGV